MSQHPGTKRLAANSPRLRARIAGGFYLLCILTGVFAAFADGRLRVFSAPANIFATACYVVVTLLLYGIFKPVNGSLSLLAALFSLAGCGVSFLKLFHLPAGPISALAFFGCYCVLVGYLIYRSTFMPTLVGGLMALTGLGWLTYVWPPLAHSLSPVSMALGLLGEGSLTVWLLAKGVDQQRWNEQATSVEVQENGLRG